ncbi:hypothetical protein DMB66_41615 [Actinoplanes sp. ATCC 53533]|uniref:hypothetical protein n=1 Tax=Actinoplanes sp. ATCC 53533 TaxID=1288362 RepID=UPI000F7B55AF|nr:hypothetical protein [Actinoplanes sp. ATCC 53533]RSM51572.1 hypothetical protein DMB66_41615 [Actinoplanes sp. ATCC 53533]
MSSVVAVQLRSALTNGAVLPIAMLWLSCMVPGLPSLISREVLFGNPERISPAVSHGGMTKRVVR